MEPIQLIFCSPIAATLFAVVIFMLVRLSNRNTSPGAFSLFLKIVLGWALGLGVAAFAVSLFYSKMVGASTGPLGAIFVFGPLGFTVGVIIGTVQWFFNR